MTLKQIFEELFADRGPLIALFLIATTLVQVAPLKINPWSAMFRWIGDKLNTGVITKINEVEKKVDNIESRLDKHIEDSNAAEIRARRQAILDFASSLIRGDNYNREKFEFMMKECDSYKKHCKENDIINGVADTSIQEIKRVYEEKYRTNGFLMEQGSIQYSVNGPLPSFDKEDKKDDDGSN